MKLFLSYCFLLSMAFKCTCNPYNESEKQAWVSLDKDIDESCSLYLMYYFQGAYMYHVGTTGVCKNLTKDKYIETYDALLSENLNKILIKRGKIIFDTDFSFGNDSLFRKKLINITDNKFGASSRIIDMVPGQLTIELMN